MPERIVVVRRAPGYRTLVHRLTLAFEKRASNERRAWALVFLALAEFLVENGLNGLDQPCQLIFLCLSFQYVTRRLAQMFSRRRNIVATRFSRSDPDDRKASPRKQS